MLSRWLSFSVSIVFINLIRDRSALTLVRAEVRALQIVGTFPIVDSTIEV
jgi:hypothetical protein